MTGLTSVAIVTCTGAFVSGMVLALLGSLKLKLAERLQIGEARVGGLLAALHLALVPCVLVSGVIIDAVGEKWVLVVGALVLALSLAGLTLRASYLATLVALLGVGAGLAGVSASSVVLMPDAFGFGPREVAASVNLGHVFVALGALLTPGLVDLLLRTLGFRRTLGVIALVCLAPAVAAALTFGRPTAGEFDLPGQRADLGDVVNDVQIWLLGIAFLLYAPLEYAVSAWGTTYLTADQGYAERRAAWVLSLFWLAFLASRVLVTLALHRGLLRDSSAPVMILVLAFGAAVALGNLGGGGHPRRAVGALIGLGFALGPIVPTLTALALERFRENRGTAYGTMFALGSLGSLVLMPVIGVLVRGQKIVRAMRLLAPLALLLVVAALAIWLR